MKKTLSVAALALTLAAGSALATNTVRVMASDGESLSYDVLYTESAWMTLVVPMWALDHSVPGDLSLSVHGLPAGTTITLKGTTHQQRDGVLLLPVKVKRSSTSVGVNSVASIDLMSGGKVLTTLTIPVMGTAQDN